MNSSTTASASGGQPSQTLSNDPTTADPNETNSDRLKQQTQRVTTHHSNGLASPTTTNASSSNGHEANSSNGNNNNNNGHNRFTSSSTQTILTSSTNPSNNSNFSPSRIYTNSQKRSAQTDRPTFAECWTEVRISSSDRNSFLSFLVKQ